MPKETNSTEKNTQASNDNKVTVKKTIKIKWNALDGLLSVVFLVVLLVGIYFGTAALLKYLDAEKFINLNISSIDNLTFSILLLYI